MFHKLRFKLTLINTSIILALFLLLTVGVYYFAQLNINRHRDFLIKRIVADIQVGIIHDLPQKIDIPPANRLLLKFPDGPPPRPPLVFPGGPPPRPNIFFVKVSPTGSITFHSSGQPLLLDSLTNLTEYTLQEEIDHGTIAFEQTKYYYYKTPLTNQSGKLVLFYDLTQENNMMQVLMSALIVVGIACSLLTLGASFFMANHAMIPIEKSWQQQKNFISDVSHELRTPLFVIQTNLDIIKGSPEEKVYNLQKWVDNIQTESICMMKLVDSLLFLARTDSQRQMLNIQPFSYNAVLMRVVACFEVIAAVKGVSLEVAAPLLVKGHGDETLIKQAIGILVDNAIRHTPTGGKVVLSLIQTNNKALLTVADSGEGIAPEHLNKIFDRFYQADKSRNKGGAGLGLAIAKWIVESHKGFISVMSTVGTGTTFNVKIPLS